MVQQTRCLSFSFPSADFRTPSPLPWAAWPLPPPSASGSLTPGGWRLVPGQQRRTAVVMADREALQTDSCLWWFLLYSPGKKKIGTLMKISGVSVTGCCKDTSNKTPQTADKGPAGHCSRLGLNFNDVFLLTFTNEIIKDWGGVFVLLSCCYVSMPCAVVGWGERGVGYCAYNQKIARSNLTLSQMVNSHHPPPTPKYAPGEPDEQQDHMHMYISLKDKTYTKKSL